MQATRSISRLESTREVRDDGYPNVFLDSLSKIFGDDPSWCSDVTFLVEDAVVPAHRIVLSAFSDYFRGLFKMQQSAHIPIHGVGKDVFKSIISFAYSGSVVISTENVQDLLLAANYYGCTGLVEKASAFMVDFMETTNVIDVWELADSLSLESLCGSCRVFVTKNFETMWEQPQTKTRLLKSPLQIFEAILKSEELIVRHSDTKLLLRADDREKAVIKYVNEYCSAEEDRGGSAQKLLRNCVNWIILSSDEEVLDIFGDFEDDLSEAKGTLSSAIKRKESLRDAFVSGLPHELRGEMKCPKGHRYVVMNQFGKDIFDPDNTVAFPTNELFIGCECLRAKNSVSKLIESAATSLGVKFSLKDFTDGTIRKYSCSYDYVAPGMADGNHVGRPQQDFVQIANPHEHITALKVTTRTWDGREVIQSVGVTFSSGRQEHHGGGGDTIHSHDIKLHPGEHVVDIKAFAGWMIDSLAFEIGKLGGANLEIRKVGPFGGDGGGEKYPRPPSLRGKKDKDELPPFVDYLVGFKGKLTLTQGQLSVTHLAPVWRSMSFYHYEWILRDGQFHSSTQRDDYDDEDDWRHAWQRSDDDDDEDDDDEDDDYQSDDDDHQSGSGDDNWGLP